MDIFVQINISAMSCFFFYFQFSHFYCTADMNYNFKLIQTICLGPYGCELLYLSQLYIAFTN